jgi:hypothetical protein
MPRVRAGIGAAIHFRIALKTKFGPAHLASGTPWLNSDEPRARASTLGCRAMPCRNPTLFRVPLPALARAPGAPWLPELGLFTGEVNIAFRGAFTPPASAVSTLVWFRRQCSGDGASLEHTTYSKQRRHHIPVL